jgi:hypothetical protein
MPASIPHGAAAGLPPARMIDPRGHRFGAGLSAILIAASFVLNQPLGVALAFLSIGVSGALGLKYSIYGAIWRRIVKAAHLGPTEMEHEYPPRFAQVFGSVVLAVALLAFLVVVPTHVVDRLRALVLGMGLSTLHSDGGLSCFIVRRDSPRTAASCWLNGS